MPATAWANSASSAPWRSRSISCASIRLASPYQMSLTREKGMSSRCEARRIAAFTLSAAGRGSAHRRTRVCASSIEEVDDEFGNLVGPTICCPLTNRCLTALPMGGRDGWGPVRGATNPVPDGAGRQLIIMSHFESLYIRQSRSDVFSRCFGDYLLDCFFDPLASADGAFRLLLQHEAV